MRAFPATAFLAALALASVSPPGSASSAYAEKSEFIDYYGFDCVSSDSDLEVPRPWPTLNHLVCTNKHLSGLHKQLAGLYDSDEPFAETSDGGPSLPEEFLNRVKADNRLYDPAYLELRTRLTERAMGPCELDFDPMRDFEAKWVANDCLASLYQRLIRERGDQPVGNVIRGRLPGTFIHPACLDDLLSLTLRVPYRANLSPCHAGTKRVTFMFHSIERADRLDQTIVYHRWNPSNWGGYLGYSSVGRPTRDTDLLWVFENDGGSGRFHSLALVRGLDGFRQRSTLEWLREDEEDDWIEVLARVSFGNRCKGGLAKVSITGPTTIQVSVNITPFALLALNEHRDWRTIGTAALFMDDDAGTTSEERIKLEADRDLVNAAMACIGTADFLIDLETGERKFTGVVIDELYYWNIEEVRFQACFNHLVRSKTTAMPLTLTPRRLAALGGEFVEQCMVPASGVQ